MMPRPFFYLHRDRVKGFFRKKSVTDFVVVRQYLWTDAEPEFRQSWTRMVLWAIWAIRLFFNTCN